jgi:hypothetical protein
MALAVGLEARSSTLTDQSLTAVTKAQAHVLTRAESG